jgi:hypothetical protein
MSWQAILSIGSTLAALLMGFLYAKAAKGAALADGLHKIATYQAERLKSHRDALAAKEQHIRELEQTVVGSLSPGELANRLNSLFGVAADRRATDAVPAGKPATAAPGAAFRRVPKR